MAFRPLVTAVAIACVAVTAWTAQATGHQMSRATAAQDQHYTDPAGWSLDYPETMFLERSEARLRRSVFEVTIASFLPRTAVTSWQSSTAPDGASTRHSTRRASSPPEGVAFRIVRADGGPSPNLELPETTFPLHLESFEASNVYPNTKPRPVQRAVVANGRSFQVAAWIGESASPELRAALERVVSSLSFPPLRPGTVVGYGFTVLQPSDRYPVGSFTRVRASGQPFYLVHAPGGFYAVGWRWQTIHRGYKSRCQLDFDARRLEFFCANLRARWDRVGRVIAKPRGAQRGDPLNLATAKVAWDGHVLLQAGSARFADARFVQELWPGWRPSR